MPIPPGFVKCEVCGQYNGKTASLNLNWHVTDGIGPDDMTSVTCICHGIPCRGCGVNKIPRPISNTYDEETNSIGHWPYFTSMMLCHECYQKEQKEEAARENGGQ